MSLAFPTAYFFWWASRLSAETATNGIGPHYFVPAFVTLAILAARGLVLTVPARLPAVATVAVAMVAVTAWALPDKVAVQRDTTRRHRAISSAVPDDLTDAVVVVDYGGRPYVLSQYPFLAPDPALEAEVLYAADRGAMGLALIDRFPERDLYRLGREVRPGDDLFSPTPSLQALQRRTGRTLHVTAAARVLPPDQSVRAYVTAGSQTTYVDLGRTGAETSLPETSWTFGREGSGADVELDAPTSVLVGIEYAAGPGFAEAERVEEQIDMGPAAGGLRALTPGRGWGYVQGPNGTVRVAQDTDLRLGVEVAGRS